MRRTLSLFMVNVAYRLQADGRQRAPAYSVLDLKADCRGHKYVEEMIKMLWKSRSRFYWNRFATRWPV